MLDANIKENIRAVTTPEQAYTALGFTLDTDFETPELVRNWNKTPVTQYEGKFGVLNKIAVNQDDDTTNLFGKPSIQFHTKRPKSRTVRYLVHADVPVINVQFPSDFDTYSGSLVDKENPHADVLFIGGDRWVTFDLHNGTIVEGLAVGDFATMWGLFCTASASELAATYMHYLSVKLGEAELRHRMHQMTARLKDRIRESRVAQERREVAMLRAHHHIMNDAHDAAALAATPDLDDVRYHLIFIEDAERPTPVTDSPWYDSFESATKVHASAKRMGELAWAHRSVKGVSTPYAIWNPGSKLWELL